MVARNYRHPHEFVCITDDATGIDADIRIVPIRADFAHLPGPHGVNCYRRLRMFAKDAADWLGPRFVSLDLDMVILGDLAPLWNRPEDFVAWGDIARSTPYNGSMMLHRAGTRAHIWETFDPVTSPAKTREAGLVGSDQAWIGYVLGWTEPRWGTADGIYSWPVHLRRGRVALPADARVVMFHGSEDPWMPTVQRRPGARWVRDHYR